MQRKSDHNPWATERENREPVPPLQTQVRHEENEEEEEFLPTLGCRSTLTGGSGGRPLWSAATDELLHTVLQPAEVERKKKKKISHLHSSQHQYLKLGAICNAHFPRKVASENLRKHFQLYLPGRENCWRFSDLSLCINVGYQHEWRVWF